MGSRCWPPLGRLSLVGAVVAAGAWACGSADGSGAAPDEPLIVAAIVDGELSELSRALGRDVNLQFVTLADADGMRIYRRSLSFLLIAAAQETLPGVHVHIDHAVASGGFYCRVSNRPPLSPDELQQLKVRMDEIVAADEPIVRQEIPLEEAAALFRAAGDEEKVRLLAHRTKPRLVMYTMRGTRNYLHGYMVPSSGYIRLYDLEPADGGFILRYPRRRAPTQLAPTISPGGLLARFREYDKWLDMLDLQHVSELNEAIQSDRIRGLALVAEALHEDRIGYIASQIAERKGPVRIVLIAGPSASGKTTFSKRLSIQLLAHGIRPYPLAMDDFFVPREQSPRDEQGDYDFESIYTLNLERLNADLLALMDGRRVTLPRYNFKTGLPEEGPTVQLGADHIIILEGIHGLNPVLLPHVPSERTYRIYVSALTQLNLDRHNRISTTDARLVRRIARAAANRGYSARATLARWESVQRGEKRNILPYQNLADVMFNSTLPHELAVLRPIVEPLLMQVKPGTQARIEVKRLLALLQWFHPAPLDLVPENSILREFVSPPTLLDRVDFSRYATIRDTERLPSPQSAQGALSASPDEH